jgi:hypothetical protein
VYAHVILISQFDSSKILFKILVTEENFASYGLSSNTGKCEIITLLLSISQTKQAAELEIVIKDITNAIVHKSLDERKKKKYLNQSNPWWKVVRSN